MERSSVQLSLDREVLEMNTDSQTKINKKNKEVEEVFITNPKILTSSHSKNQCILFWKQL